MPLLPVTLKGLFDVGIRKTQPVKQKQITLFEYMEKLSNIQLKVQEWTLKQKSLMQKVLIKGLLLPIIV